jgi:methionine-rich copper-binding protein CopC
MSAHPLTNAELFAQAPSIFADKPIEGVSDRYNFVATHSILDTFRKEGYYPIMAGESKVRNQENFGYQKHIIQFRLIDNLLRPKSNTEYADIVLTNSHNRTSSFVLDLAYWRIVCQNMLVVPSHSFQHHSIIHSGFQDHKIGDAISEVVSFMPTMEEKIELFKSITLSPVEQKSLAKAAIDIRFDTEVHRIAENELLKVHRIEDENPTLWNIFNRVQESIIGGGIKGHNKQTGRNITSKAITSIDSILKLNKELWSVTDMIASYKQPSLTMAA